MPAQISVTLPDGSPREVPSGATVADVAAAIGPKLAKAAVAGSVDGQMVDLARPVEDGEEEAAEFMAIKGLAEAGLLVQTRRESDWCDTWAEAEWALTISGNMAAARAGAGS